MALIAIGCGSDDADVSAQDEGASQSVAVDEAPDDHGEESAPNDEVHSEDETTHDETAEVGHAADLPEGALVFEVEMNDFGYEPSEFSLPASVPVRLLFTNVGAIEHEAMVGDSHQQDEFAADGHDGEHGDNHHGELQAITLEPGESGHLDVTFAEPGELMLGCHLPGHWDAGMKADFVVA